MNLPWSKTYIWCHFQRCLSYPEPAGRKWGFYLSSSPIFADNRCLVLKYWLPIFENVTIGFAMVENLYMVSFPALFELSWDCYSKNRLFSSHEVQFLPIIDIWWSNIDYLFLKMSPLDSPWSKIYIWYHFQQGSSIPCTDFRIFGIFSY